MKLFLSFFALALLFSCNNTKKETATIKEKIVYDMYQPSEMSLLMKSMYDYNVTVRQRILEGEKLDVFPSNFLNIHSAELSDFKSRNETFEGFSKLFIQKEKEIFDTNSSIDVKQRFNSAINLCIACHKTECTGPIPKIRKLLIQ